MSCSNALSIESGRNSSAILQALPSVVLSHSLNRRTTQQLPTPGLYLPGLLSGMSDPHSHLDISWMVPRHVKFSISQIEFIIFQSLPLPQCFCFYSLWFSFRSSYLPCSHLSSYSLDTIFFQKLFFHSIPCLTPSLHFLVDSHSSFRSQLRCCFLWETSGKVRGP